MTGPRTKPDNALGQQIKARRRALGLSQRDLVAKTGDALSNPYLCQLETGKTKSPTLHVALALAKALGITIEEIAAWTQTPFVERPTCQHCGQELDL